MAANADVASSSSSNVELDDAGPVEELPEDLTALVADRKDYWAERYRYGINADDESDEAACPRIQYADAAHWPSVFERGKSHRNSQKGVVEWDVGGATCKVPSQQAQVSVASWGTAEGFIPGLPDDIVEEHIWPRLQKQFRRLSTYSLAEKGEIVEALRALRCVSRRWNDLVAFSYEWAVYRMVQWDFVLGWVWCSYHPTIVGPLTELARMVDLLPEPNEEATPHLHFKMGFLETADLWMWRGFLNHNRYLRYNDDLHCGQDGEPHPGFDDSGDEVAMPCMNCFHYPRWKTPVESDWEEDWGVGPMNTDVFDFVDGCIVPQFGGRV